MTLQQAVLSALLSLAPPSKHQPVPGWPREEPEVALMRYTSISWDIAVAAGNRPDAAALVGVAVHESGLYRDVDFGACYHGPGWESRCDGGKARGIWQLQATDPDMSRASQARLVIGRIRWSLRRCAVLEPALRLSAYASGSCQRGGDASRQLDEHIARALARMPAVE